MGFSPEIEAVRRVSITATDAAPIARLTPWRTPADIWLSKKKPELCKDFEESPALYWGKKKEALILAEYAKRTGYTLSKPDMVQNEKYPWMKCSPDSLVKGKRKGVEAKTAARMNAHEWGAEGTDQVPEQYLIQVAHSMMCTGYDEWDVPVLIDNADFRIYHVTRDEELLRFLFEIEEEFYRRFIIGNEQPKFDWGKGIEALIRSRWPKHKPGSVLTVDETGDALLKRTLETLCKSRSDKKGGEIDEKQAQVTVKSYMGEKEELLWSAHNLRITWRSAKDKSKIDYKAAFQELLQFVPDGRLTKIIEKHTETVKGCRTFRVYDKSESEGDDD